MTDADLSRDLDALRDTMVSVATGGERIESANPAFRQRYDIVSRELNRRGIANALPS